MTRARTDWIDRLAFRAAPRPVQQSPEYEQALEGDDQLSRGAAIKLALAGAAALWLGATPGARAQGGDCYTDAQAADRSECFTKCLKCHDDELYSRRISCRDVFRPREIQRSDRWTFGRYRRFLSFGGERDIVMAGIVLEDLCNLKAEHEVRRAKDRCYDGCETTCRQRSLQSSSSHSGATCEVTPPTKAPPPRIPTPPDPASDACGACNEVGGLCCGSCPRNPQEAPCVTLLTDGTPAEDCAAVLARCS